MVCLVERKGSERVDFVCLVTREYEKTILKIVGSIELFFSSNF